MIKTRQQTKSTHVPNLADSGHVAKMSRSQSTKGWRKGMGYRWEESQEGVGSHKLDLLHLRSEQAKSQALRNQEAG